jgi:hypothetical protein
MTVRQVVENFAALGTLPDEKSSQAEVLRSQERLERIQRPVSDAEAALLVKCFGPDESFGLAWMLLHLIESAPGGIPLSSAPSAGANQWITLLWERSHR